eukprot:5762736-Prymnesium_polylepis.1
MSDGAALFAQLCSVAGADAEKDLYFDETTGEWDLEGLQSDLNVYLSSPNLQAASPATVSTPSAAAAAAPQHPAPVSYTHLRAHETLMNL